MTQLIQRLAVFITAIALVSGLVSCGGNNGNSIEGTGTVGILLTDMPADPALFVSINASIRKVELLGSEDNGRVTLYSGDIQTFDLLRLRNESIPFAFADDVPVGDYCKIRLTLSDLELVLVDDTPDDSTDNETYHPKLPGNGKLDLVARGCFSVVAGGVVTLQLDIDAGKSIHIVDNKNGFNFRPVIFIDVVNQGVDSKLVRLTGEIAKIDVDEQSFLLCRAIPNQNMDNLGCVNIHLDENSAFFDNQKYGGEPRSIDELLAEDKLGLEVTVVGWPEFWINSNYDYDPGDQYYPLMQLDALVVELGEFLQVEGSVAVDADPAGFAMTVSSDGLTITDSTLAVMFQPGDDEVNGTRIVSKSGEILEPIDVKVPLPVQVDGTPYKFLDSVSSLKAALVIIDKSVLDAEQVTGVIHSVETGALTLAPDADVVCDAATEQLMVGLADEVEILTVTITQDSALIAPGDVLAEGQTVGMNGSCEVTGYQTDNVVIIDDQRV